MDKRGLSWSEARDCTLVFLRLLPLGGFASKGLYWDFRVEELSGPVGTWVSGVPYELCTEGMGRPRDKIDSLDS